MQLPNGHTTAAWRQQRHQMGWHGEHKRPHMHAQHHQQTHTPPKRPFRPTTHGTPSMKDKQATAQLAASKLRPVSTAHASTQLHAAAEPSPAGSPAASCNPLAYMHTYAMACVTLQSHRQAALCALPQQHNGYCQCLHTCPKTITPLRLQKPSAHQTTGHAQHTITPCNHSSAAPAPKQRQGASPCTQQPMQSPAQNLKQPAGLSAPPVLQHHLRMQQDGSRAQSPAQHALLSGRRSAACAPAQLVLLSCRSKQRAPCCPAGAA